MHRKNYILLLLSVCIFVSCTPHTVREAQSVVAQADSLWHAGKMYGLDEGDSATLAQAYETLSTFNSPLLSTINFQLSTDFSRLCYHYGRLLREKDNPVAAMQVFIDATHTRTRDDHILGRVYSNMGSICHLAGEFPLSYDMYKRSADCFLQNGDTINYYYGLNNMVYELAEQGEKDSCFSVIKGILANSADSALIAYCYMSQAQAYLRCKQYDSVIVYAYKSKCYCPSLYVGTMQLAQAYSHIGNKDSAAYYAKKVLATSHALSDINNALYILTNDDETKNLEAVRQTAAKRADTHKFIAIRQGKLSQAIQLLEQDLTRKPDLRWLYAIIGTLAIIVCIIGAYVYRKRKKQELLTQKIDVLEKTANTIQEKKDELSERYLANHKNIEDEINKRCSMLRTNDSIKKTLSWKNYNKMCNIVDKLFYLLASKLRAQYSLNETEVRLCILTLLECDYNRMAELLYRSSTSIGTLKIRVAKKLGTTAKDLRSYLIDNVCIT